MSVSKLKSIYFPELGFRHNPESPAVNCTNPDEIFAWMDNLEAPSDENSENC